MEFRGELISQYEIGYSRIQAGFVIKIIVVKIKEKFLIDNSEKFFCILNQTLRPVAFSRTKISYNFRDYL